MLKSRKKKNTKPIQRSKIQTKPSQDDLLQHGIQSRQFGSQDVLHLQGIIGNQAVQRLLDEGSSSNANDSLVQRSEGDDDLNLLLDDDLGTEGFTLLDDETDVGDGSGDNEEEVDDKRMKIGSDQMIELKKGYRLYLHDRKQKAFVRNQDASFLKPPPAGWEYQFFEDMGTFGITLAPVTKAAEKERKKLKKQEERQWAKEEKADIKRFNKELKQEEKQEKREAKQEKKEDKEREKQFAKEILEEAPEVLDAFDDVLSQNADTEVIIEHYRSIIIIIQNIGDLKYPNSKKKKIIKKHSETMRTILERHWDTYRELFQEELGILSPMLVWLTNAERKDLLKKINKGKSKKQAKRNFDQIYNYSGQTNENRDEKRRAWYDSPDITRPRRRY